MKTLNKSLRISISLILLISLFNCSSDNDIIESNNDSNRIEFDGQIYQINDGFFESGNYNEFSMALFPKGISINYDSNYYINGGNWYLEIDEIISDDNTIEGTYTSGEDVFGYFINNAQFLDDVLLPGKIVQEINKEGTLTINKIGIEYEVIYETFDNRNNAFTAYYKGPLVSRR